MCVSLQVCACAGKLPSPVVLNSKASAQRLHHAKRKFYRPSADSGKESCSHISIHFPTSSSRFPSLRHWKKILQKILETVLPQLQLRESAGPTIMDRRSSSMEFRKFGSSSSTFCIFPRLLMQVGKMILRGWLTKKTPQATSNSDFGTRENRLSNSWKAFSSRSVRDVPAKHGSILSSAQEANIMLGNHQDTEISISWYEPRCGRWLS